MAVLACPRCGRAIPSSHDEAGKAAACPWCAAPLRPSSGTNLADTRLAPDETPTRPAPPPPARMALAAPGATAAPGDDLAGEVARARVDPARRFGPFLLLSQLGKGGMGVVHRAWDERLRRVVALKTILPASEGETLDAAAVARFRREAEAAARLRHPSIVSVHEAGEVEGRLYMAMDLVAGRSFDALLRPGDGRIAWRRALEVVRDVARAVHHSHAQGVVHRDLKPQNVIVDDDGRPHVLDFGLAAIKGAGTKLTKTGASMGTPAYMPPEQANGEPADERADVYSLGAILYHVLTGRPPFQGESDVNLIVAVLTKEPVPPGRLEPRARGDLETICLRCLEKEKERRYPSAEALAREIDRFLAGEPIEARPVGAAERASRWGRRNRWRLSLAIVVAAVFTVLLAAAIHVAAKRKEEEDKEALLATRRKEVSGQLRVVAEALDAALAKGDRQPDVEYQDSLARIGKCREPEAVAALGEALDVVTAELRAATREAYLAVLRPNAEETARGEREIPGLEAAVDRLLSASPDEPVDPASARALSLAAKRLVRRAGGAPAAKTSVHDVLGRAQEVRLGPGRIRRARLAAESLGWIAPTDGALAPLARHLAAEEDEQRAVVAAAALLKLGEAEAEGQVVRARERFGADGVFWKQVERLVRPGGLGGGGLEPKTSDGFAERSMTRRAKGDVEGALADASRAIELARRNPRALTQRALARKAKGDVRGAVEDFSRVIEVSPQNASAWTNRGTAKEELGDLDGALADHERALALDPRDPAVLVGVARARTTKGSHRPEDAIALLTRAVEIDPKLVAAWVDLGLARLEKGDIDGAIADFGRAIALDPGSAVAWSDRATARARKRDFTGAQEDYARALELDPRRLDAWAGRAKLRRAKGQLDGAIADYDRAIELAPTDMLLFCVRGDTKAMRGDQDGAIADFTRAIELDPNRAAAFVSRGLARRDKGDLAGAIADYTRAIELDPKVPGGFQNRSEAKDRAGDIEGALADASRAVELHPDDAGTWWTRGVARLRKGDAAGAVSDFERVVALAPGDADAWKNLGLARDKAGDFAAAAAALERYLELRPDAAEASDMRKLIARLRARAGK